MTQAEVILRLLEEVARDRTETHTIRYGIIVHKYYADLVDRVLLPPTLYREPVPMPEAAG